MKTVSYSSEFTDVIALAKEKQFYVGTGNPSAKILFIGKEAAIDEKLYPEQHQREIENNISDWEKNIVTKMQFSDVDSWFRKDHQPTYNPLYPYKDQKNKIRSVRKKDGIVSVHGEGGTSKTWYNYQKIIDTLISEGNTSLNINFHGHAFISELNQITGPYSNTISKKDRKISIQERKVLFEKPFFREFPITIVAVGHYVRDFDINLQAIFMKTFHEALSKEYTQGLNDEYLNIHFDNPEKPTQLLIHTNQLSMVSTELITRIGQVCSLFLNGKINP